MKKSAVMFTSGALASLGVSMLCYTYMKKHPVKTQVLMSDVKSMMKDLK